MFHQGLRRFAFVQTSFSLSNIKKSLSGTLPRHIFVFRKELSKVKRTPDDISTDKSHNYKVCERKQSLRLETQLNHMELQLFFSIIWREQSPFVTGIFQRENKGIGEGGRETVLIPASLPASFIFRDNYMITDRWTHKRPATQATSNSTAFHFLAGISISVGRLCPAQT